jgi:FAD synthase
MDAVANLGTRPTFDGRSFLVEVHLINFSGELYGAEMEVAFVERLRGETAFTSPAELAQQIQIDVAQATAALKR